MKPISLNLTRKRADSYWWLIFMTYLRPRSNSSFMAMASICQDWRQSWWLRLWWINHFWKMDFNSCSLCSIQTRSCNELCLCWYSPNSHWTKTEIKSQTSHRNELIIISTSGLLPVHTFAISGPHSGHFRSSFQQKSVRFWDFERYLEYGRNSGERLRDIFDIPASKGWQFLRDKVGNRYLKPFSRFLV